MRRFLGMIFTLCFFCVFGTFAQTQSLDENLARDAIEGANFYLSPRNNYEGHYWIRDEVENKIIGYSPWDPVKRRWTLFNLRGDYQGFIQATIGSTNPPHFIQYLWFDKDNLYKGVFIASLGGRPVTPDLPYGELGGSLNFYDVGNIPLKGPSYEVEVDPLRRLPEGIETEPIGRLPGR